MEPHVVRLFDHLDWADRRVLAAMRASPLARVRPASSIFAHVLASERVWLLRLRGEDGAAQPIWPDLEVAEMEALAEENRTGYSRLLSGLGEGGLARTVAYTNSRGQSFRTAVGDILTHVAMHGSYHRGQVARAMREAGAEPVNTDFITYVRERPEPGPAPTPGGGDAWTG